MLEVKSLNTRRPRNIHFTVMLKEKALILSFVKLQQEKDLIFSNIKTSASQLCVNITINWPKDAAPHGPITLRSWFECVFAL